MIKAVIFDLDGVLVDADKWHFNALNVALQHSELDPISWQEHLNIYKGIPTRKKLEILTERKGLAQDLWPRIHRSKQEITRDIIEKFCIPDPEKIEMMRLLKRKHKIAICSNAVRDTVKLMLEKSSLLPFVEFYVSNEDCPKPKPAPDMYMLAFDQLGLKPEECVIVEDSDVGKKAATASGAVLCSVSGPGEVNYYRVLRTILESNRINIVVPSAGQGKRFAEVGFQHPKPLIDVLGKPMIYWVLSNFHSLGRCVVIMQQKHIQQYCANTIIQHTFPNSEVIGIDGITDGAACTVLLAADYIDNDSELIIANSDQYVDVDLSKFVEVMRAKDADGGILTFHDNHPKWSYAKCDATGKVSEVAEKIVISDQATVGIYYYRRGRDFVRFARRMIEKNIRVNNEFYVCPIFNEFIHEGRTVFTHVIDRREMHGMGTPEDLDKTIKRLGELEALQPD